LITEISVLAQTYGWCFSACSVNDHITTCMIACYPVYTRKDYDEHDSSGCVLIA